VGTVLVCDVLLPGAKPDRVLTAALDEPAHVATAALALLAAGVSLRALRHRGWVVTTLAAAVLIDLDHVPLYLGAEWIAPSGRPLTHSLATPLVLLAIAAPLRGAVRRVVLATALGVGLHLVRDIATGPGVPLWWPLDWRSVRLPYPWYAAAVVGLGVISITRIASRTRGRG